MRELTRLLGLSPNIYLRIALLGKCFCLKKIEGKNDLVRIKNCRGEETVDTTEWAEISKFIRNKVIDPIAINDETLYERVLVELVLSYSNYGKPSDEMRKERARKLCELAASEPLLTKLTSCFDR